MDIKPQLSLFPNSKCTQCDKDIPKNHVYCHECSADWVNKYLNDKKLEKK